MNKKTLLQVFIAILVIILYHQCSSTKDISERTSVPTYIDTIARGDYRIMFYNCENFFDLYDDSLKRDDEFTPDGKKYWTYNKYQEKLGHIARVITSVGGWIPPEIVGVCEVENYYVLEQLTENSPLKAFNYKIIHYESPDKRGIDVGLLYIPSKFKPLLTKKIPVVFTKKLGQRPTRDILYVKGLTNRKDTLHIFVNHWPSRWGGMLETEGKRMFVASLLRTKIDSLLSDDKRAKIIIMGDLNDFPTNKSITKSLKALHDFDNIKSDELYNLSYYLEEVKNKFSHRYQGEAGILDQMIISGALLDNTSQIYTTKDNAHVYAGDFLLEKDANNVGLKPFRTYIGYKYHGGYSDHLPVFIDLFYNKKVKK